MVVASRIMGKGKYPHEYKKPSSQLLNMWLCRSSPMFCCFGFNTLGKKKITQYHTSDSTGGKRIGKIHGGEHGTGLASLFCSPTLLSNHNEELSRTTGISNFHQYIGFHHPMTVISDKAISSLLKTYLLASVLSRSAMNSSSSFVSPSFAAN